MGLTLSWRSLWWGSVCSSTDILRSRGFIRSLVSNSKTFRCFLLSVPVFPQLSGIPWLFPTARVLQVVPPDFRSPAVPEKTSFGVFAGVILEYGFGSVVEDKVSAPVCSRVWLPHQRMSMKALLWVKNVAVWRAEGWWMEWRPGEQMRGQGHPSALWAPWKSSLWSWPSFHLWSFLPGSLDERSCGSHHLHHLLVWGASGFTELWGFICRWKQVQISASWSSPPTWFQLSPSS